MKGVGKRDRVRTASILVHSAWERGRPFRRTHVRLRVQGAGVRQRDLHRLPRPNDPKPRKWNPDHQTKIGPQDWIKQQLGAK